MKKLMVLTLVLALLGASVLTSWAGMHFVGGFSTYTGSIGVIGTLVGFGGGDDASVSLTATAVLKADCVNKGGKVSPGRSPIYGSGTSTAVFPMDANGTATIGYDDLKVSEETIAANLFAVSPHPKEYGCPNGGWTVKLTVVNWTSATLKLYNKGVLVETIDATP